MSRPHLHEFICECGNDECHETVLLTPEEFDALSQEGQVINHRCLDWIAATQRFVLRSNNEQIGYAVVVTPESPVRARFEDPS
jgi:hypothetical protein